MKIIEKEFNVITGQEIFTEREETVEEKAHREVSETEQAIKAAEAQVKAAQRKEILDRLGLTEEEARLLLG